MNQLTPSLPAPHPDCFLMKKRELAARLGVSPRTIDNWLQRRVIPVVKPSARLCLFDPNAVRTALDRRFGVREEGR